ncbi:MAG: FtsX-like permease family protein [Gemmatimonadota bacterium]
MTSAAFVVRMAWREARAARRRLLLLTASVMAGVGALVAVNSFTENLKVSVAEQAQALLGADLSLTGKKDLSEIPPAARFLDSLTRVAGPALRTARSTSFAAMAFAPNGGARLVQLRTVDGGWPWYGTIETSPAGVWPRLQEGGAIVDPSLLTAIGAHIGDTLGLGDGRFPILGTVVNVPGDVGLQMAFGARVFIAHSALPATKLLGFGARADFTTFLQLPSGIDAQTLANAVRPTLRAERVRVRTVADDRDNLTDRLTRLGNYLGLVALAALLLGGLGVASAVHVFIRQKLDSIAMLRCLGATSWQVFAINLLQALAMGLLGSLLGALLGVGLQQLMPLVLKDFIPVDVRVRPSAVAILMGIGLGVWTAGVFSLLPLLGIRAISPLATLRRDVAPVSGPRRDPLRLLAVALLTASIVGLASVQVGSLRQGSWFAAAIGIALLVLWLASQALIQGARRWTPARWPYLWRQGLANLHRPANQTGTVVLALGFGAFLLTTLFTAQHNLLRELRIDDVEGGRPNLFLFDIQNDQRALVDSTIRAITHAAPGAFTPIVPMRLAEVKGRPVRLILARGDTTRTDTASTEAAPPRRGESPRGEGSLWAYRREYRSTYRSTRGPSEKVTRGEWFGGGPWGSGRTAADPVPISVESSLADELSVTVGDAITWDLQGILVYSRVTSLREVNWARFEPNFFVVFAPGALEKAPQTWVTLARVTDAAARGQVQRSIAEHAANVTSVDFGDVQRALEEVVSRIILAIRFMAFFSLATGTIVLIGAIATSRWQRVREGTLLRTLGATRRQVLQILMVEYAALGLGASLVATGLAAGAGWALAHFIFRTGFSIPWFSMTLLAMGLVALTTAVGLWNSLDVLKRPPNEVLRAE